MILSSIVSISAIILFLLPSVDIAGSTEVVVTIFGITIVFGNDSFSSLHVISDDLLWFNLLKNVLQDSLTIVCVLERPFELSLLTLV